MGKQVTRRTPEERKAQAEALHASIADQVQQLTDSDQWRYSIGRVGVFEPRECSAPAQLWRSAA